MEEGPVEAVFGAPRHPYTRALLEAEPDIAHAGDGSRRRRSPALAGDLPRPIERPPGCVFSPRCPVALPICSTERPGITEDDAGHRHACRLPSA